MNKILNLLIAMAFSGWFIPVEAQQVVSAAGGYYEGESLSMSWTVGEPVIETFAMGEVTLTQGFQQPYSFYLQQILNIPAGWSGVSTWLDPIDKDLDGMFLPVQNDLIILASIDGVFYPTQGINTIGNWNCQTGYQVKAENDFDLTVSGTKIPATELMLAEGWNLLPVLSSSTADVENLFSGFAGLQIVKQVAGPYLYWPEYGINTLGNLDPGKAYYVAVDQEGSVIFPDCSKSTRVVNTHQKPENNTPWNGLNYSAVSHVVAFPAEAFLNSGIRAGDVIGVFTPEGLCAGRLEIHNTATNASLAVFADDALTSQKDGFEDSEPFSFKIYRPEQDQEFELETTFDPALPNTGYFADHGISAVRSLKVETLGMSENSAINIDVYPNPSQGIFNVTLNRWPVNLQIQITDMRGSIVKVLTPGAQNAGSVYTINLTGNPRGVYFLKLLDDGLVGMKKVVVQ